MTSIELPNRLLSLYTTELKEQNGSYILEIPNQELHYGDLQRGETYKIALLPAVISKTKTKQAQEAPNPPVQTGDIRETEVDEEVTVEITNVTENFALGEVTSGHSDGGQGREQSER